MKALLALPLLALVGATQPHFHNASVPGSPVVQVLCGPFAGSAFRVSPTLSASVNHVTSLKGCTIDGEPINVSYHSGDFSLLVNAEPADRWLTVDCSGFVKGREYLAKGYARAVDQITTVELTATGQTYGQLSILSGIFTVVPGQSGGAVVDADTGKVVGTINTYDMEDGLSGSVALKDTPLCQRKA